MPSAPFVVPPLILSLILLASAAAKLRTPSDTAAVFRQLRLPQVLVTTRAPLLLPYGEIALVALLLLAPGTWYLVAATLVLLLFTAYLLVVARALRFPYVVRCGCFGRLGLGEVTRRTLVRNVVLLAIALVTWADAWRRVGVVQRLQDSVDGWWWVGGVLLAVATTALVVWDARAPAYVPSAGIQLPPDPGGYPAMPTPYVVLDGPDGLVSAFELSDTAARMLVFLEPADPAASDLMARLDGWADRLEPVRLHLVADGEWAVLAERYPAHAQRYLGDPSGVVRGRFGIEDRGAVLLGTDRFLAGGPSVGDEEVEELMEAAIAELHGSAGLAPDEAPAP